MSQTNITIRIDAELKKEAEKLFDALGMNMTTAITVFTKAAVREQRIPFELSLEVPNTETLTAIHDVENRRNLSKSFDSVTSLMEDLNDED